MKCPTDEVIESWLIGMIADGFNRSLRALRAAKAVDTRVMDTSYCGVGSKYYDLVTEQMVITAKDSLPGIKKLFLGDKDEKVKF